LEFEKLHMMNVVLVGLNINSDELYSLSLRYLKAYARKNPEIKQNVSISIMDYGIDMPESKLIKEIMAKKPDLVGFSAFLWNMDKIISVSKLLKESCPDVIVVVGGPQVSCQPKEILSKYHALNVIVKGEGEATFEELILCYLGNGRSLLDLEGIAYREGKEIKENADRPVIENIDDIPSPYVDDDTEGFAGPFALWQTFRGCVHACTYCNWTSRGLRLFSSERLKKELEYFMKNGIERLWLIDSDISLNRKRLRPLLETVAEKSPPPERIGAFLNLDNCELADIHLYSKLPFGMIEIGLQTINPTVLTHLGRHWNKDRFERNWFYLRNHPQRRSGLCVDLIIGLPGDDHQSFKESMRYVVDVLKPDTPSVFILQILRGSKLYEMTDEFGFELEGEHCFWVKSSISYSRADMRKSIRLAFAYYFMHYFEYEYRDFGNLLIQVLNLTKFEIIEHLAGWLEDHPHYLPDWYDHFLSYETFLDLKSQPISSKERSPDCGQILGNQDHPPSGLLESDDEKFTIEKNLFLKIRKWNHLIDTTMPAFIRHLVTPHQGPHRAEEFVRAFYMAQLLG
jgi:radical SAM superfamily enzyme YgiQ (UPF0313 family)